MAVVERIFGVSPSQSSDSYPSNCEWFPSLVQLSSQTLLGQLVNVIIQQEPKTTNGHVQIGTSTEDVRFWQNAKWISLRTFLHQNLADHQLEQIYDNFISESFGSEYNHLCRFCKNFVNVLNHDWRKNSSKITGTKRFLFRWLIFKDSSDRLIHPHPERLERDYLVEYPTGVRYISTNSHKWTPESLESCLVNQSSLHQLKWTQDSSTGHVEELQVIAKFAKLSRLSFDVETSSDSNLWYTHFLGLLYSQIDCLQSLDMSDTVLPHSDAKEQSDDDDKSDGDRKSEVINLAERFWKSVSELLYLRSLQWNVTGLATLVGSSFPQLPQVNCLSVYVDNEELLEDLEIGHIFPNLDEFYLNFPEMNVGCIENVEFFKKVTTLEFFQCLGDSSKLGQLLPNLTTIHIGRGFFKNFDSTVSLKMNNLKNVFYDDQNPEPLAFVHFKLFFNMFPNVTNMELKCFGIDGYDDIDFVSFLSENRASLSKLKHLVLDFARQPKEMTGETVCAILRICNVEDFRNLVKFRFSDKSLQDLIRLVHEKNLNILVAQFSGQASWFLCERGSHQLYADNSVATDDDKEKYFEDDFKLGLFQCLLKT